MTKYLSSTPFSVPLSGDQLYRDNYDAIDWGGGDRGAAMTPMPAHLYRCNAGVACDMLIGPCACGATHSEKDVVFFKTLRPNLNTLFDELINIVIGENASERCLVCGVHHDLDHVSYDDNPDCIMSRILVARRS